MPSTSVSLSKLVAGDVSYEWHEAVALVAQLIDQVRADIPLAQKWVPHLGAVSLEQNGTLAINIDPAQAMPGMPGAAQILQQLLSGRDQPAALRLLILQGVGESSSLSLDAFAAELARWEPPNRPAILAALHRRAADVLAPGSMAPAPQAISAAAPAVTAAPAPVTNAGGPRTATAMRSKHAARPPRPSLTRREQTILAGSGAVVVGIAIWIATGQPIPFTSTNAVKPQPVPAQRAARSEVTPPVAATETIAAPTTPAPPAANEQPMATGKDIELPGAASSPRPAAPPAPSRPAASSTAKSIAAPTANKPPVAAAPSPARPSATAVPARPDTAAQPRGLTGRQDPIVAPNTPRAAAPSGVQPAEPPTAVNGTTGDLGRAIPLDVPPSSTQYYRPGDPGVTPPVPLARLPRKPDPGTPANQLQVLEVHVRSDGTVETARFVDTPPSYRNRWWTSAAKSWRFRPAVKNGRPVPFVMRILIEDPGGA